MRQVRKKWWFKRQFHEELEQVFDSFPNYHTKILLGEFNAKLGKGDIFKLTIRNGSLHQGSSGTGVRVVNYATSKNLVVKSTMFPDRKFHEYTWTSSDSNTQNQIDHILIYRRWNSSIFDVRSFRETDCDTGHNPTIAKVREILAVSNQAAQNFDPDRFDL